MKEINPPAITREAEDTDAAYINAEHDAGQSASRKSLRHFLNAGRRLVQKKAKLLDGKRQGGWAKWLKTNCPKIDRVKAWRYTKLAELVTLRNELTTDDDALTEEWRRICGNAPPAEEEPPAQQAALSPPPAKAGPAPRVTRIPDDDELPYDDEYPARQDDTAEESVRLAEEAFAAGPDEPLSEEEQQQAGEELIRRAHAAPPKKRAVQKQEEVRDALGTIVPPHLRDVFADGRIVEQLERVRSWRRAVEHASAVRQLSALGPFYRYLELTTLDGLLTEACDYLDSAIQNIERALPHALCPDCKGAPDGCESCRSTGYVPAWRLEELADHARLEGRAS